MAQRTDVDLSGTLAELTRAAEQYQREDYEAAKARKEAAQTPEAPAAGKPKVKSADPSQPASTVAPLPSPKPAAGRIQSAFDDVVAYASTLFSEDEQETPEPVTLEVPDSTVPVPQMAPVEDVSALGPVASKNDDDLKEFLFPVMQMAEYSMAPPLGAESPEISNEEEAQIRAQAAREAFDLYVGLYRSAPEDDRDEYLKTKVRAIPVAESSTRDALITLADSEYSPFGWFDSEEEKQKDTESLADKREMFAAQRGLEVLSLGPNKQKMARMYSALMDTDAEYNFDVSKAQRELTSSYVAALKGDEQFGGKPQEEILAEAIRRSERDIRGALSTLGRPAIWSVRPSVVPAFRALEAERAQGMGRISDGLVTQLTEARLAPRRMALPESPGFAGQLISGASDLVATFGWGFQVLGEYDPAELGATAVDVAGTTLERELRDRERQAESGVLNSTDILTSGALAVLAGAQAGINVVESVFPAVTMVTDPIATAVFDEIGTEEMRDWRHQVRGDLIIAAGDNEDLFDLATGALPVFAAAATGLAERALTDDPGRVQSMAQTIQDQRREFIDHQVAAKFALFVGAVLIPGPNPLNEVIKVAKKGRSYIRAKDAMRAADKLAKIVDEFTQGDVLDVGELLSAVEKRMGNSTRMAVHAALLSKMANAAETDVGLLSRSVSLPEGSLPKTSPAELLGAETAEAAASKDVRNAAGKLLADANIGPRGINQGLVDLEAAAPATGVPQAEVAAVADAYRAWRTEMLSATPRTAEASGLADAVWRAIDIRRDRIGGVLDTLKQQVADASTLIRKSDELNLKDVDKANQVVAKATADLAALEASNPVAQAYGNAARNVARATRIASSIAEKRSVESLLSNTQGALVGTAQSSAVMARMQRLDQIIQTQPAFASAARAERQMLQDSLDAANATGAPIVTILRTDLAQLDMLDKQNATTLAAWRGRMDRLGKQNPKVASEVLSHIQTAADAAKRLTPDAVTAAQATRQAQASVNAIKRSANKLQKLMDTLDNVEVAVYVQTRTKLPTAFRLTRSIRKKIAGTEFAAAELRRSAALGRVRSVVITRAEARALAAAGSSATQASVAAAGKAARSLGAKWGRTASTFSARSKDAAMQRSAQASIKGVREFAESFRTGAKELLRRGVPTESMGRRTGRTSKDVTILSEARDTVARNLGKDNIIGKEVTQAKFDDIAKGVADIVARRASADITPAAIVAVATDPKGVPSATGLVDEAVVAAKIAANGLGSVIQELALARSAIQYSIFEQAAIAAGKPPGTVLVENAAQAATELAEILLRTRSNEAEYMVALVMVQSNWAKNGWKYAIHKFLDPRAGHIGEGSDLAWAVYKEADQVSAGYQAWIARGAQREVDKIMSSRKSVYTQKELEARLVSSMSLAFEDTSSAARMGLPVDTLNPFAVAKRFFTQRNPNAVGGTLSQATDAIVAVLKKEDVSKLRDEASEELVKASDRLTKAQKGLQQFPPRLAAAQQKLTAAQAAPNPVAANIAKAQAEVAKATADIQAAQAKVQALTQARAAIVAKVQQADIQLERIRFKAASSSSSQISKAASEGAFRVVEDAKAAKEFDVTALSMFDKMVLNVGLSVYRGVQTGPLDVGTVAGKIHAVALDALKKANTFEELHTLLKKNIAVAIEGSGIIEQRAPRSTSALAGALLQGVVAEYTTQLALRRGLGVIQQEDAKALNALLHRPLGLRTTSSSYEDIRSVSATLEEAARIGARINRTDEGKGSNVVIGGAAGRTSIDMSLVEGSIQPGFDGGVWVPQNVYRAVIEDLEGYARDLQLVNKTPGSMVLEFGKATVSKIQSIWRTQTLVGYGINFLRYRMRAIFGDVVSIGFIHGPKQATQAAVLSGFNGLPFVREQALKGYTGTAEAAGSASAALRSWQAALLTGTAPMRIFAPSTWVGLPRHIAAAMAGSADAAPRALMGIFRAASGKVLTGNETDVVEIAGTSQTVVQWWSEMRYAGILDNNIQINLRTALKRYTKLWSDITEVRIGKIAATREWLRLRKTTNPAATFEDARDSLAENHPEVVIGLRTRLAHMLGKHQENLESVESQVHVTTRAALYLRLREQGLSSQDAAQGVMASVYDWNYGANKAALNALSFMPFGRFHLLRRKQGFDALFNDTTGGMAVRRAILWEKFLISTTGTDVPTEEELDSYLQDASDYGRSKAEEWGLPPERAAKEARQDLMEFMLSAMYSRKHATEWISNRHYTTTFPDQESQQALKAAYGTDAGNTLVMHNVVPNLSMMDSWDWIISTAIVGEITFNYMVGEDEAAENAATKLMQPATDLLPDAIKAGLGQLMSKADRENEVLAMHGMSATSMQTVTPAEAALLNALGATVVELGDGELGRSLMTTTDNRSGKPRVMGAAKSVVDVLRILPGLLPAITKPLDAAYYKNPKYGQDWDVARAAYTVGSLIGLSSQVVSDPLREAGFDQRDLDTAMQKKLRRAEGAANLGGRALDEKRRP